MNRPVSLMPRGKQVNTLDVSDKEWMASAQRGVRWRHEWKYELTVSDALAIQSRLKAVATPDPHTGPEGKYWIRSLYFDNSRDKALMEKINGTNPREKFRIRYYNYDTSLLHLEKKYKRNGLGTKFMEPVSPDTVQRILAGDEDSIQKELDRRRQAENGRNSPFVTRSVLEELLTKIRVENLRPKVIIDYMREPYLFEAGDVRVTFDYNIRTGWNPEEFLNPRCDTIPAVYPLRETGDVLLAKSRNQGLSCDRGEFFRSGYGEMPLGFPPILLEVKWGNFLPEIIRKAVQSPATPNIAFSKYAQGRAFL